jgi:hypothetical protein
MASTFTKTRDSIIISALRKLGVVAQGQLPEGEQVSEAADALETYLKHLQASTELRWDLATRTEPIISGTATYALTNSTDVIDIYDCYLQDAASGAHLPIRLVDQHFFDQNYPATAMTSARPSVGVLQFNRDSVTNVPSVAITIYPTPPQNYTLHYRALVKQKNMGVGTDALVFDELWFDVLIYGLCTRLCDEYVLSVERCVYFQQKYEKLLEEAQRKSRNTKDTFFIYPI